MCALMSPVQNIPELIFLTPQCGWGGSGGRLRIRPATRSMACADGFPKRFRSLLEPYDELP